MEYLLFLIPGILVVSLNKFIVGTIPPHKNHFYDIVDYIILTTVNAIVILLILQAIKGPFSIQMFTNPTNFNRFTNNMIINDILLIITYSILITTLIVVIWNYTISLLKWSNQGSTAYIHGYLRDVIRFYDKDDGTQVYFSDMCFFARRIPFVRFKRYEYKISLVKILDIDSKKEIAKGRPMIFNEKPWKYSEMYLDNYRVFDTDFDKLIGTYINLENKIIVQIWEDKND